MTDELSRIAGEWKLVRAEPPELRQMGQATFIDDTVQFGPEMPTYRFRIDPTQAPKWIDIEFDLSPSPLPGIYELDGRRLRIYMITEIRGDTPAQRPKGFDGSVRGRFSISSV